MNSPGVGALAKPPTLGAVVRGQFERLADWAALPQAVAHRAASVLEALTEGALDRPAAPPFDGLSRINANGLPFQWSFSLARGGARSLRFLCEPGAPGTSARQRCGVARACLARALRALDVPDARWLDDCVLPLLLPGDAHWPEHWRSALWFGAGASARGVLIKPYLNLNRDAPLERWRRLGRVFQSLGRQADLEALCALSGRVSRDSWPVGLALDVLPDGACGRVKAYFRSGAVGPDWLERWYVASGGAAHAPALRAALDAFPYCGQTRYPDRSFVVSLEFHEGGLALKTDLAVTRWMSDDAAVAAGTRRVLRAIGAEPDEFDAALRALGAWPPDQAEARQLRFVGVGHEPDGSEHLNVYVEPPLPSPPPAARSAPAPTPARAREAGLGFLLARQDNGLWRDYTLPVGTADQWITAYVLWMLSGLCDKERDHAVRGAIAAACAKLLHAASETGGLGYHAGTGCDADSTSLGILALRAHGQPVPAPLPAFLDACRAPDGGMGTYAPDSMPGGAWCQGSCEVSAAALLALQGDARLAGFLARERRPDGLWPAYWWHTPLYPTWLALRALPRAGKDPAHATLRRFEPIGAFETALLLLCCLEARMHDRAGVLAAQLAAQQSLDGGWPASALLRLTDAHVARPARTIDAGPSFVDHARIFTSATAVGALLAWSGRPAPSPSRPV